MSANGRRYFTAVRHGGVTTLAMYDAQTGRARQSWTLRGRWNLGGVSATGRRVALALTRSHVTPTTFVLFDTASGRETARTTLRGAWDVDGVANDGRRLFLIQYLRTGYLIRLYDLGARRLAAHPLTEKGAPMNGTAWNAVATPNGRWLVTLYLRGDGDAELHTLDLVRGTAVCIDVPTSSLQRAQAYALALAPDGHTVFAANPALGVVVRVDLRTKSVVRTDRFAALPGEAGSTPLAAISHDGRTLYFGGGRDLWAYDAAYHVIRGAYDAGGTVSGLAFTRHDRKLLVLHAEGTHGYLHAPTGRRL